MDPGSVLEHHTTNLSNLPAELTFLLHELRQKDLAFYDHRKKLQQYDAQIHKFIKQHGSLANNPKEAQLYPKIRAHFQECETIQKEKCKLANTSLFLLAKHLSSLENDIGKLEKDGLLQLLEDTVLPIDNEALLDDTSSVLTADSVLTNNTTSHGRGGSAGAGNGHKRTQSRKSTTSRLSVTPSAGGNTRPLKRQKVDHAHASASTTKGSVPKTERQSDIGLPAPDGGLHHKVKTEDDSISDIQTLGSLSLKPSAVQKRDNNPASSATTGAASGSVRTAGPGEGPDSATNTPTKAGAENSEDQTLYCFCRQVSFGEMIGCDNSKCRYEWFHYKCVGLTAEPTGKWYCPDCAKRLEKKKRKKTIA